MKKVIPKFKNTEVKHRGRVVRNMVVRRKTIYLAEKRRVQY